MYYKSFLINRKKLHPEIRLHFDLFNLSMKKGDITRGIFAPFSHDAESFVVAAPEPELVLTLAGFLACISVARQRQKMRISNVKS